MLVSESAAGGKSPPARIPEATDRGPEGDGDGGRRRRQRHVLAAFVVLAGVLFLAYGWQTIVGPFGDSHDGRNGAMWAAQSRSLLEEGPVASKLGARTAEMGTYADHPPLITLETAAAELVGGSSTAVIRAPAWIGSLAALLLLAVILRERGLRASAVGIGVLLAATTPMFLIYGTMLDSFVTSLPVALGLLLVWTRARDGRRVRLSTAVVLAAAAVLAGWQAFVLATVVGSWSVLGVVRRRGPRRVQLAFATGAFAGLALLLAWLMWSHDGSLKPLIDQYLFRSGSGGSSPGLIDLVRGQARVAAEMFGAAVLVLAIIGLLVALWCRRIRPLALVSLVLTVPYTLMFPLGASNHDYWNYWFLLPLAVGLAAGTDRLMASPALSSGFEPMLAGVVAAMALLTAIGLRLNPSSAQLGVNDGFAAGRVAKQAQLPPGQQNAWFTGAMGIPPNWLAYRTRRPAVLVPLGELARLAAEHGDDLVLVGSSSCVGGELTIRQGFRRASDVARRPPVLEVCP